MSEYDQLLSKKRENRKFANTLEGIIDKLRKKQFNLGIAWGAGQGLDKYSSDINIYSEILELETLIDKLRI